ncbi:LysR substrate-binding domain-containing protein [Gluconacetobacter sp. Hr-1-5]|uniref:LysR substrate-binding domain-containing protein n=1 Tax=Gluconacetobacter sp. Hr-1-5 TaxID=3395370 RepID=UPI003B524D42
MSERALPLRGIAVFEAAARASSFQAAAEELNLTPSAVSHQIRLLEDILGVQLFDRVGRGVTLTPDGAEYARAVRQSIRRLRSATGDIRARGRKGRTLEVVRIEMPPSFAHCWLLPRLPDLLRRLPGVDIRINAQGPHLQGDRLPFPPQADAPADIQIVYGDDGIWEDRATHLIRETFQACCAPGVLEQHALDAPERLLDLPLISTSQNPVSWEEWLNLHGVDHDERLAGGIQLDPSHLAIEAAVKGIGIILESDVLAGRELSSGTLVRPFPALGSPGLSYWMYTPSARKARPAVATVMTWLRDRVSAAPA